MVLYNHFLRYLRKKFVESSNRQYCGLRVDVLKCLQSNGNSGIYEKDPCHRFVWMLESCTRPEEPLAKSEIGAIESFFAAIPPNDPMFGDLSMMVHDPRASMALLHNLYHAFSSCGTRRMLPSADPYLVLLCNLLSFGHSARVMIKTGIYGSPVSPHFLADTFAPILVSRILISERKLSKEIPAQLLEKYHHFIAKYPLAQFLVLFQLRMAIKQSQLPLFQSTLADLAAALTLDQITTLEPSFLPYFATFLPRYPPAFQSEFDQFLTTQSTKQK